MSLVGKKFPNITVDAMSEMGDNLRINILEEATKKNKKVVLFWYPKDFTFVCPTELHAFEELKKEFEKRNTIIIGASVDTCEVHFAWLNTPKDQGILEADHIYNEELENYLIEGSNVTFRATFLIDENGKVFHESVNDMPLGRNVKEYLRLIDAYTHVQKYGEVCPANWEEGKEAMHADRKSTADYLAKH